MVPAYALTERLYDRLLLGPSVMRSLDTECRLTPTPSEQNIAMIKDSLTKTPPWYVRWADAAGSWFEPSEGQKLQRINTQLIDVIDAVTKIHIEDQPYILSDVLDIITGLIPGTYALELQRMIEKLKDIEESLKTINSHTSLERNSFETYFSIKKQMLNDLMLETKTTIIGLIGLLYVIFEFHKKELQGLKDFKGIKQLSINIDSMITPTMIFAKDGIALIERDLQELHLTRVQRSYKRAIERQLQSYIRRCKTP
jgi:hypothetical protein